MSRCTSPHPLLELSSITVVRDHIVALDDVSLTIYPGEHVAILGPNGSGKSTLIKTITRECYPLASENGDPPVRIMGEDTWDVFQLRSMLGIISGDLQQMCTRTISGREMVLSGFFASVGIAGYHRVLPEMERKTDDILEMLEITHLAARLVTRMSTGQVRRVLIARALVHDPHALILDEPRSGLDPHAARRFSDFVRKIAQSGKSVIMVTHHLHDILPEIERVIMLKNGKVFCDGPKDKVLTEETLSELFSMPVEIQERGGYRYLLC